MKAISVAVISLVAIIAVATQVQSAPKANDQSQIAVSGEASVRIAPNKIMIRFGIETSDIDATTAKFKNTRILKEAISAIKKAGVPESAIEIDNISLHPQYNRSSREEELIRFVVRNTFIVTLKETRNLDRVVSAGLEAGVNHLQGVDFQTTELKKYREQARENALIAAKEKADKMAQVLGRSVGRPIYIEESHGGLPWNYYSSWSTWGRGFGRSMSQNITQSLGAGVDSNMVDTALGKISVNASVKVTFEIEE